MTSSENRVKHAVTDGKIALGFVCRTLSPAVVEMMGLAGFHFVWIDMEHSGADFATVEHLCRAADATDLEPLVRVPDKNPSNILRALEVGARIVNVPQVEEKREAEEVVRAAKYYPLGARGYSTSSRGTRYGFGGQAQGVFEEANKHVMTMVQIESVRGVENASEICSVPGLDAVFIGLSDLSQSLGLVGQLDHPKLLSSAGRVLEVIRAHHKIPVMMIESTESAAKWLRQGVRVLACGVDITALGRVLQRIRVDFSALAEGHHS